MQQITEQQRCHWIASDEDIMTLDIIQDKDTGKRYINEAQVNRMLQEREALIALLQLRLGDIDHLPTSET